jgi:hypothetical protein
MGSEEAKEKAEFGREQRKRGPSTKQREAAEATELECSKRNSAQQKEAAERKKRKKAPEKSAVESAELSVGTVLNTQYSIPSAASSSSISATQHLQPSKRRMSRQNKLHKARRARTRRSTTSTATSARCGQPPAPSRGSPLCCSGKASFRHDLACEDAPRAAQRG